MYYFNLSLIWEGDVGSKGGGVAGTSPTLPLVTSLGIVIIMCGSSQQIRDGVGNAVITNCKGFIF